MKRLFALPLLALFATFNSQYSAAFAQGTAFTFQGRLIDGTNTANGNYDLRFYLRDAFTGGNPVGTTNTLAPVTASNGLFTVILEFGTNIFTGAPRWLEIGVRTNGSIAAYATLTPRQPLTATPYAIYSSNAASAAAVAPNSVTVAGIQDATLTAAKIAGGQVVKSLNGLTDSVTLSAGANISLLPSGNSLQISASAPGWGVTGNAGTTNINFLGTTDNQPLELRVNNARGFRLEPNATSPNVIGGSVSNFVLAGQFGATISGGGRAANGPNSVLSTFGTVSGGVGNTAGNGISGAGAAGFASVGGGLNNFASGPYATVAGGDLNSATVQYATVGGGFQNLSSGTSSVVGGGRQNAASAVEATVAGGGFNNAIGNYSTIAGGFSNNASGTGAFVGGGGYDGTNVGGNMASGTLATIGGGIHNIADGSDSTVSGGYANAASGVDATVSGGSFNASITEGATVGGGDDNTASGISATVGGGLGNTASEAATVGGGNANNAAGHYSTVGGGQANTASGLTATVGGGYLNVANLDCATVGGGCANSASGPGSFVGGGGYDGITVAGNTASGAAATVGGGHANIASGPGAFVGGGGYDGTNVLGNTASGAGATVVGGLRNIAIGIYATVGGGTDNSADGPGSFVGGGGFNGSYLSNGNPEAFGNSANGVAATVGGGIQDFAFADYATVGGGANNTASGELSTVPGGFANTAGGVASFAAGQNATANHDRCFIWSSYGNTAPTFGSDTFFVSALNGIGINCGTQRGDGGGQYYINLGLITATDIIETSTGAHLTLGGVWANASDKNRKTDFVPVSSADILEKLAALSVRQWRYTNEPTTVKHVGPTAQDFKAAFGLGTDDKSIGTVDEEGVALAAIQGLDQKVEQKDAEIQKLMRQNDSLAARLNELEATVKQLAEHKR